MRFLKSKSGNLVIEYALVIIIISMAGAGVLLTWPNLLGCAATGVGIRLEANSPLSCDTGSNPTTLSGVPNGFVFADVAGAPVATLVESAPVTIAGFSGTLTVSVTGQGSPQIRVGDGDWQSVASITSGQSLRVRLTASASPGTTRTASVAVGATTANFSVRTQ